MYALLATVRGRIWGMVHHQNGITVAMTQKPPTQHTHTQLHTRQTFHTSFVALQTTTPISSYLCDVRTSAMGMHLLATPNAKANAGPQVTTLSQTATTTRPAARNMRSS